MALTALLAQGLHASISRLTALSAAISYVTKKRPIYLSIYSERAADGPCANSANSANRSGLS